MQQYEKYRRVEPSERGTAMFDEMLRLKRENMILEDENKTLKKKLQKAVSYTHLDVYKRQALGKSGPKARSKDVVDG